MKFYFYLQDARGEHSALPQIMRFLDSYSNLRGLEKNITQETVLSKNSLLKKCCLEIKDLDDTCDEAVLKQIVQLISSCHGIGLTVDFEDNEGTLSKQYECEYQPVESFTASIVFEAPYIAYYIGCVDTPMHRDFQTSISQQLYLQNLQEKMHAFLSEHNCSTEGTPYLPNHTVLRSLLTPDEQAALEANEFFELDPRKPRKEYFIINFQIADPSKINELFISLSEKFDSPALGLTDLCFVLTNNSVMVNLNEVTLKRSPALFQPKPSKFTFDFSKDDLSGIDLDLFQKKEPNTDFVFKFAEKGLTLTPGKEIPFDATTLSTKLQS